jgi:uncharacterized protein YbcI
MEGVPPMIKDFTASMADRIATAAGAFQLRQTGRSPAGTTVVLKDQTLVITMTGALSQAERVLSQDPDGAAHVQEFHRRLFKGSADEMRAEIRAITGVAVGEAQADPACAPGATNHAFTSGAMIQVFLLDEPMSADC